MARQQKSKMDSDLPEKYSWVLVELQHMENYTDAFIELKFLKFVSLYILEVVLHVDGEDLSRNSDIHHFKTINGELYM